MKAVKELIETVRSMRAKQKEYFKTRSHEVMIEAKQLESKVDKLLLIDVRYCTCAQNEKHGKTSAMHCNECGGLEHTEQWLK